MYDKIRAKKNIEMGYYDTLKSLRGLKGRLYYIEAEDEEYYLDFLSKLSIEKIGKILKRLDITEKASKRILFEYCIPKLASFIGLKEDFTYEEFTIELLERKALELGIEEFRIYSFEELLASVRYMKPIKEGDFQEENSIEKALKKVDLAKYFNKDEIINEIANIIFIDDL